MKKSNKLALFLILFSCFVFAKSVDINVKNEAPKKSEVACNIVLPERLHVGDTVGLVSSAFRAPEDSIIEDAKARLEALGLHVKYGKYVFARKAYFAGTDQERAKDINEMFADPSIKAIFEVRGGWGSSRILPYLDYAMIKKNPKIIVGFSDITSLLLAINAKTGLVTFHGTMGVEEWPEFTVNYLKKVLFDGELVTFSNPVTEVNYKNDIIQTSDRIRVINKGITEGRILGGNLSTLVAMLGSKYLPNWQGAILFVEDVDEDYYKIDRMMSQLQLAGVLTQIAGFVFGQCVSCGPKSGSASMLGSENLDQILEHYIKPLGIPAWSGAMIGHMPKMWTLPEGSMVKINAENGEIKMLQEIVK